MMNTINEIKKQNKKCYTVELDPTYCQIIINRWQEYTGQKAKKIN